MEVSVSQLFQVLELFHKFTKRKLKTKTKKRMQKTKKQNKTKNNKRQTKQLLGKGKMQPFVHLSIRFLLYRSSMSSNFFVFYTSGGISSKPAAFLFFTFLSTTSSFYCINCPRLISCGVLIVFVIGASVTLENFPSRFSKCCFHRCIRFSWLATYIYIYIYIYSILWSS